MDKISKNITYDEAIHSQTAKRLGIENKPNDEQLGNMLTVAQMIFQPLREWVGGPIKINSFFRSPELNKAIGGSSKSQHCKAAMFDWIRANLDYDQMIWEFGTDQNPSWVHVSYVDKQSNRNRCLKAYKEKGKTKYMVI